MRVISLINGTLISQTSSLYAMQYAKKLHYKLDLVYVTENIYPQTLHESIAYLQNTANSLELENEFLTFESLSDFKEYIQIKDVDMLFCSTRHDHSFFDKSFAQKIVKMNMEVDLAIIKVVKLCFDHCVDKIILPIRGSKLSVKKFSLFYTFAMANDAKAEIYSIDQINKRKLSNLSTQDIKDKLKETLFNLRHYFRIAKVTDFKFTLKHDYTLSEGSRVRSHIAQNNYDLAIIGAHHEKSFFTSHPIDILFEKPTINTLYFVPHNEIL